MNQSPFDLPTQLLPTAQQPGQSPRRPEEMSSGMLLGFAIAIVVVVVGVAMFALSAGRFRMPPLLETTFVAWLSAGLGLLTVWLGLGGGRIYVRLLVVGIVLSLAFLFLSQGHWEASVFADLSLFVVATAMPFGAMYIFGLRLTNTAGTRKPVDGDVESRLNQFSLRQLFGWIGACALVAGVARFANVEWRDWASFTVFGGAFSLVAVGASLAALLPGRSETVLLRLFLLGVSTIAVVGGFAILELGRFANVGDVMYIAFMGLEHTALITIALLLYRRIGYRLERQRSTGRLRLPVAHEAVAHDAVAHDATTPRD